MNYPPPKNKLIDLGLPSGTLWAERNVGAESPTDIGLYFSWGNVEGYPSGSYMLTGEYDIENKTWSPEYANTQGALLSEDIVQGSTYDAAKVILGDSYVMPTAEQCAELIENTTHTTEIVDGVQCEVFTGTNGNRIVFPHSGYYVDVRIQSASRVYLWTTKVREPYQAYYLRLDRTTIETNYRATRSWGMVIRPVANQN